MTVYLIAGGLLLAALLYAFINGKDYGKTKAELKEEKMEKEAVRQAQEAAASLKGLSDDELRERASKWVRK